MTEDRPSDPVRSSTAPAGELQECPPDGGTIIELTDQENDTRGLLIQWDDSVWMFARKPHYDNLGGKQ
jgi:hypothetical protein